MGSNPAAARGKTRPTSKNKSGRWGQIYWSAEQYSSSLHCTVVANIFVADQLSFFIVFYQTYRPPERGPCPFIGVYMAPTPSDQLFLVGGRFSLILSGRGMGPCDHTTILLPTGSEGRGVLGVGSIPVVILSCQYIKTIAL